MMRRFRIGLLIVMALLAALFLYAFLEARGDPLVRTAHIAMPGWPVGVPPVRVVLLSDIHGGGLATPPARLARVVAQINALQPDLVVIAGDFTPGHKPIDAATVIAALAPLKDLTARLGVFAVPGNHDHWTGLPAVEAALTAAGIRLLVNQAIAAGPLELGGVDDAYSQHAQVAQVVAQMRQLPGVPLVFTHSPDIAPQLPADFPLLLAGHTHCGQAVVPLIGSLDPVVRYQARYRCGIIREGPHTVIVTGGIGGSLPLRLNAPPDLWLLILGE